MASPVSVNRQQAMEAAATESLSRQTIMVSSALGDAADALAANKGMRCLIWATQSIAASGIDFAAQKHLNEMVIALRRAVSCPLSIRGPLGCKPCP